LIAFLPVALLLAAALSVAVLQRLRPSIGYSWLIGSLASAGAFGFMLYLRWRLPQQVVVAGWLPFTQFTDSPIFGLDGTSWPYAFSLSAVILAMMLTASARLAYRINPWAWAGGLLATAIAMLAVYSANLLTIALAWTAIDLLDVIILSAYSPNRILGVQSVISFAARVTGMILVVLASLINRSQGFPPTFGSLPALSALLLLLAAGLRLGVLPLNLPALPDMRVRRGLGTVLRMASSASSLAVLARLPAQAFSPRLTLVLLSLTAAGVLYAAARWLAAKDEIEARPYWLIALAGMAVFSDIQGNPTAGTAWGVALLLSGSMIFLYSARARGSLALPLLGLLGFSGLPFTPAAAGWPGILTGNGNAWQIVILFSHLLLMLGYLRHSLRPGDVLRNMERWVQTAYPLGLALLVLAQWTVGVIGWQGSFGIGVWWAAVFSGLGLVLVGGISTWLANRSLSAPLAFQFYQQLGRRVGAFLSSLLSLGWLYTLLWAVYRRMEQAVLVLTAVLEGDGGVLWVLVLLAMLISLIIPQVSP
jgi:hypothetical protein